MAKKKKEVEIEDFVNFMGQRYIAMVVSVVLLLAAVTSLAINGLQFGLDFTGGLQIEARYANSANLPKIRSTLDEGGFKDATIVYFGSEQDVKITTQQNREDLVKAQLSQHIDGVVAETISIEAVRSNQDNRIPNGGLIVSFPEGNGIRENADGVLKAAGFSDFLLTPVEDNRFSVVSADGLQVFAEKLLVKNLSDSSGEEVLIKRTEFVGPQVGDELRDKGGIGLLFALAVVMLYVAFRFQFKFSVGAVAALAHDVIIVLGFFSFFKLDFDLTVLAAVLAVIGYSLNDTIVVSDRIRENFRKIRKLEPINVINVSLTQTLGRTLITSLTTMLVLLALFFVGGELIHAFSIALMIGIVVGTYSSIYVAANIILLLNISKEDLMVPVKEGVEQDSMP